MEISTSQMQQLRKTEIEMLKNFIYVCDKLNLQYFIVQGTLLGAVRHQGFIPWDDDIDVGMLREDYEVFLKKGQKLLQSDLFLQTCYTDPEYPQGYAKIRKNNTSFAETTVKNIQMHHGIYIDVFPFDYYNDKRINNIVFSYKKTMLRYRIGLSFYQPQLDKLTCKNIVHKILRFFSKIIYPSSIEARIKQDELYKSIKEGNKRINHGSPWGKRECVPEQWLLETTILEFEGIKVKAPLYYDEYLTQLYGDYMTPPPPEERIPHHYISELSFTKPYHPPK